MARPHHGRFDSWLRGGQTVGHTFDMVVEVLLRLGLISVLMAIGVAVLVNTKATPAEQVAGWVSAEAWACKSFGPPLPQRIGYTDPAGKTFVADVGEISQTSALGEPSHAYWHRALGGFCLWLVLNYFLGIAATLLFVNAGREKTKARQVRGQEVTRLSLLIGEIDAFNRAEHAKRDPLQVHAPAWRDVFAHEKAKRCGAVGFHASKVLGAIGSKKAEVPAASEFHPPRLAGVPYPYQTELEHTLIVGAPGAGKSQAFHTLIETVRAKGERGIIFDPELDYIRHHYNPATDMILNPFDSRSQGWSPFYDAINSADWAKLGHAIFKDPRSGDPYWVNVARSLFAWTGYQLHAKNPQVELTEALDILFGPVKALQTLLAGTPAGLHLNGLEGARVASVISVLAEGIEPLIYLHGDKPRFSIRDWVNRPDDDGGFLFLSAPESHMDALRPLLGFWSELAVSAILGRHGVSRHHTWIFLDEFHSAGRIDKLADGPQRLRKYGGAVVLGFQQVSQLTDLYGPDKAKTIIGNCQTKLILRAGDFETASLMSDQLGRRVMRRVEENTSYGANSIRDGVGLIPKEELEPIVLAEDVLNFPKFQGMIRMSNAREHTPFPIAPIKLRYVPRAEVAPGIVPASADPVRAYLDGVRRRAEDALRRETTATRERDERAAGPATARPNRSDQTNDGRPVVGAVLEPNPIGAPGASRRAQLAGLTAERQKQEPRATGLPAAVVDPGGAAAVGGPEPSLNVAEDILSEAEGDEQPDAAKEMRPRAIDVPTEEAVRLRKRQEEEAASEQLRIDLQRRAEAAEKTARTSVIAREGLALSQGEYLGGAEQAVQSEIDHAVEHRHQGFEDIAVIAIGALVGGNIDADRRAGVEGPDGDAVPIAPDPQLSVPGPRGPDDERRETPPLGGTISVSPDIDRSPRRGRLYDDVAWVDGPRDADKTMPAHALDQDRHMDFGHGL